MKVINLTQLPGGNLSHPNNALDMAGSDSGIDFWYAQGRWKCIAGPWGNGTFFFVPVDAKGDITKVHCADGVDRIVTLALTHSNQLYVKSTVGKIYENGEPMYEEGVKGWATGNHIHAEVANGIKATKYKGSDGCWRMQEELKILDVIFVNDSFSKVSSNSLGKNKLKHISTCINKEEKMNGWKKEKSDWYYYKDGKKVTGWQKLKWSKGTDWFYFTNDGKMIFDGLFYLSWSKGKNWFLFDKNGCMVTTPTKMTLNFDKNGVLTGGKAA